MEDKYSNPGYNLTENFLRSIERFKDKIAIETRIDGSWHGMSYALLGRRVRNLGYMLSLRGVKKADRVAMVLDSGPEWAISFFALLYTGAVAVPLDPTFQLKDIENIISDSAAKLAIFGKASQVVKEIGRGLKVDIEEIDKVRPEENFKHTEIEPEDLAVLLYTSGTTDVPKGVMLTHRNLCSNYHSLTKLKLFSYKDVIISILPLYHSYPLMTTLIVPIFSGARIVYAPSDWPERLIDYIRERKITIFVGVPQIFNALHRRIINRLRKLSIFMKLYLKLVTGLHLFFLRPSGLKNAFGRDFRFFVCGGAKLDEKVTMDFLKLGFKILEGYGLTETSPVVSFNPVRRPKPGSVGKVIPDVRVKIVNKDKSGVGEIAVYGQNVTKGYYKDVTKTHAVIKDGWFMTGDLGYFDKQGYLYITGRSKELIVLSSGKNIYPEEIEKHYASLPYIREICVIGVSRQRAGADVDSLHALVVPDLEFFKERGEMNVRSVLKNVLDRMSRDLPTYKRIAGFTIIRKSLPRTILGKIKRYEVKREFAPVILSEQREEQKLSLEDKKLSESDTARRLILCIKETLGTKEPVNLTDSIELDLGVDSLGRVELMLAIERYFGIEISEEMVAGEIFTVKDILLKIEEILKKRRISGAVMVSEKAPVSWPEMLRYPLSEEFQRKILLTPGWIDFVFTFLLKEAINIFFRVFYRLRVQGADRIPKKKPYILCVNHTSFLDGFIVVAGVPYTIELDLFFMGFRRYFIVPVVRDMVRRARIIPIDATQIVEAMQSAAFILRYDKALCIFPEGERSIDGRLKEFRKGVGIIAKELDIPLVPVLIKGAFEAWPRTRRFPRLHPLEIRFGYPAGPQDLIRKGTRLGAKDEYEAIALGIREELLSLDISF